MIARAPYSAVNRWTSTFRAPGRRMARALDRSAVAGRVEALLRERGHPIAYEVFGRRFVLCEPALRGVHGDPDILIILGDAEHDLFLVAQQERAALSDVSAHETIRAALGDFLLRALSSPPLIAELLPQLIVEEPLPP